jgi:hypothetical protein
MMVVVKLRHFIVGVLFVALAVASDVWSVSANARWALMLGRGRLTLAASRSTPLFRLTNLRPGSRAASEITVRNTGTLDAVWELRAVSRGDARLLRRLRLRVYEQAAATGRICVYAGSVAALRRVALGVLPAGEARAFVFVASWPRVGSVAGGAVIGAESADVDFSWHATDARLLRADRLPARPSEQRLEQVPGCSPNR